MEPELASDWSPQEPRPRDDTFLPSDTASEADITPRRSSLQRQPFRPGTSRRLFTRQRTFSCITGNAVPSLSHSSEDRNSSGFGLSNQLSIPRGLADDDVLPGSQRDYYFSVTRKFEKQVSEMKQLEQRRLEFEAAHRAEFERMSRAAEATSRKVHSIFKNDADYPITTGASHRSQSNGQLKDEGTVTPSASSQSSSDQGKHNTTSGSSRTESERKMSALRVSEREGQKWCSKTMSRTQSRSKQQEGETVAVFSVPATPSLVEPCRNPAQDNTKSRHPSTSTHNDDAVSTTTKGIGSHVSNRMQSSTSKQCGLLETPHSSPATTVVHHQSTAPYPTCVPGEKLKTDQKARKKGKDKVDGYQNRWLKPQDESALSALEDVSEADRRSVTDEANNLGSRGVRKASGVVKPEQKASKASETDQIREKVRGPGRQVIHRSKVPQTRSWNTQKYYHEIELTERQKCQCESPARHIRFDDVEPSVEDSLAQKEEYLRRCERWMNCPNHSQRERANCARILEKERRQAEVRYELTLNATRCLSSICRSDVSWGTNRVRAVAMSKTT